MIGALLAITAIVWTTGALTIGALIITHREDHGAPAGRVALRVLIWPVILGDFILDEFFSWLARRKARP